MARTIISKNEVIEEEICEDLRGEMAAMPPEDRLDYMCAYADNMDLDAIDARTRGWHEQANFMAELAHQFRSGHVVLPGEFRGMESLLDDERRDLEETLNTGQKPKMPAHLN